MSDPTQAYAAVGVGNQGVPSAPPDSGMTWALPPQEAATQAIPAQGAPPEPDPFAHLYRPEGGAARVNPNATQVMQPVAPDFGRPGYDQPAYDQPIDYQSGGGGAYAEPYDGGYADDYPAEPEDGRRSNRGAMIGIGVAAGAVLVIVVSLITLGGGSGTPAAAPGGAQGSVTTPTGTPSSAAQASAPASTSARSSPSSSASSPTQHTPGQMQLGDTGAEVKWLQTRLHQLGLYNGPINGTFDAQTQAAVAAFQNRSHATDPSGVVGRSTRTALIAAGSKPTLAVQLGGGLPIFGGGDKHHKGANPADVKRLQQALAVALNANVKASGQFDPDTFAAVVQYQSALHLSPDGVVNGPVWTALQQGQIVG
ncbi:peptidoglycan-binding domain-containing protein [Catenulispora rubra]|uniref:peptidoglycan-binding domain-containing protein n=1 Tax=Catenulispora rubra TaxID=280293 RepID=UPI001892175D|nr:peptidoglycan-binding protein [Catenulispora rubra]